MKESFVTSQDYHGIGSPAWFLPRLEFVSEMEKLGFHLAFQSAFEGTYRGLTSPPMDGFPPTHRIPYFSNLLFRSVSQKPTNV
ncbi:MAG: hypothetical protein H8E24_14770 [Verrucomicrobia bacterium]|nr:hypothetical protein [Verrucomicrobiota bacterium]